MLGRGFRRQSKALIPSLPASDFVRLGVGGRYDVAGPEVRDGLAETKR